jgi:hypothetical protein
VNTLYCLDEWRGELRISPLGNKFTSRGQIPPLGSNFAPRGEVKNGPLVIFLIRARAVLFNSKNRSYDVTRQKAVFFFHSAFFSSVNLPTENQDQKQTKSASLIEEEDKKIPLRRSKQNGLEPI